MPAEGTELLSAKSDGNELWFSGGGAASGPAAAKASHGVVPSLPVLVHFVVPFYEQVPIDTSLFGEEDRFVDVAPVPGRRRVGRRPALRRPRQHHGQGEGRADRSASGAARVDTLPASGAGRGSAQLIAATGPEEAWLATSAGWLFHYSNGTVLPEDTDPSWAGTITVRPNESVAQFVSDTPPPDDSQLFAPPPVAVEHATNAETPTAEIIPALLKDIKVNRHDLTVKVSFDADPPRRCAAGCQAARQGNRKTAKERLKAGSTCSS